MTEPQLAESELGQKVHRDAVRQRFDALRRSVHQQLARHSAEQGIDLSSPVVLTVDSAGRVLESGRHWDRAKIEDLLRSDATLRNDMKQLLQLGTALRDFGPSGVDGGASGTARLVADEKEVFFQVV